MPNPDLDGLVLTKSERIVVFALSYLFCAPLIYANGRKLFHYLSSTPSEARRQAQEENGAERRRGGGEPAQAAG